MTKKLISLKSKILKLNSCSQKKKKTKAKEKNENKRKNFSPTKCRFLHVSSGEPSAPFSYATGYMDL